MKVLIVDDAKFSRVFLRNIVSKLGYTDIYESTGWKEANEFRDKPDLVLLDITMPDLDGLTALPLIKKAAPDCTVVMCSAMAEQEFVIEAMKKGAEEFIPKPFNEEQVKETLARINIHGSKIENPPQVEIKIEEKPQLEAEEPAAELVKPAVEHEEEKFIIEQPEPRSKAFVKTAEELYNEAMTLYKMGRFTEAIDGFDKVLEISNDNLNAYFNKALTLAEIGRNRDALICLDKVINLDSSNIEFYYAKAQILKKLGSTKEASDVFKKCLELNFDYAQKYINEYPDIFLDHAEEIKKFGQVDKAMRIYDILLASNYDSAKVYYLKGILFYENKDLENSIKCFDQAAEIDKEYIKNYYQEYSDVCFELALRYKQANHNTVANGYLDKAIKINPNSTKIVGFKAIEAFRAGNYEGAADCFKNLSEMGGENAGIFLNNKAVCLCKIDRLPEALADLNEAIKNYNPGIEAFYNRAIVFYLMGKYQAAVDDYDAYISAKSEDYQAYNNAGLVYLELGKYNEAIECFNVSINLNK